MAEPAGDLSRWGAVRLLVALSWRADPWRTLGALTVYPLGIVGIPLLGVALKYIADAVIAGDRDAALFGGALLVGALCVLYLLELLAWQWGIDLEDAVAFAVEKEVTATSARQPGLEHLERPEYLDRMHLLEEQGWQLGRAMYLLPMNWGSALRAVVTFGLLAALHPLLLLLPVFALPVVAAGQARERLRRAADQGAAAALRQSRHFFALGTQPEAAKELRLFGLQERLRGWHRDAWHTAHAAINRAVWRGTAYDVGAWTFFAGGFVLAVGWIAWLAARGERTLGDVVLALTLAGQVSMNVSAVVFLVSQVQSIRHLTGHLHWLRTFAPSRPPRRVATTNRPAPARLEHGIALEGVSFAYPGTQRTVLRDLTLVLPAGRIVALVGENGSGKTTLVKLLTRFYEPSAGRITIDGVDLGELEPAAWRAACSAAFQDFARFEFLAHETVGVGDLADMSDARVRTALGRAGADDAGHWLPRGLQTQLGAGWPDGVDLSSGQWQKLALGRTLMREQPRLLILDEPAASLDPLAEHRLFERQAAAARNAAGRNGAITLLITHHFSTVPMADLIVVLQDGALVEMGSHPELIRRGGLYAEMYALHAGAFGLRPPHAAPSSV